MKNSAGISRWRYDLRCRCFMKKQGEGMKSSYNDWNAQISDSDKEKRIQYFLSYGMDRKAAEEYCIRMQDIPLNRNLRG